MSERLSFEELSQRLGTLDTENRRRREAEERLRESHQWYQTLERLSPAGIFRTDAEGRCLDTSERWREISGLTPEEASGDGWLGGIHPEDRERVRSEWHRAVASGGTFHAEYRFLAPGGKTTWVLGNSTAVRSDGGRLLGYVGTITDITDGKRTEEALRESEERYRILIDTMAEGLGIQDRDGKVTYANRRFGDLLGYPPEELVGRPVIDLVEEDSRARFREEMVRRRTGESGSYEAWLTGRNGRRIPVMISSAPLFDASGSYSGAFAVIMDVTEQCAREDELRRRTRELGERLKELHCLYAVSSAVAREASVDEMLGQVLSCLPPGFQFPEVTCARITVGERRHVTGGFRETPWRLGRDLFVRGDPVGSIEVFYTEQRPAAAEGPFLREEGLLLDEVARRLGETFERIGAKQAELTLRDLGAKNAELEQFTFRASHDLKSPLVTIKGFLGLLRQEGQGRLTERASTYLDRAAGGLDRMERLLEELLDLSRAGRPLGSRSQVPLEAVVRDAVEMVEGLLAEGRIAVEIAPGLPTVHADGPRVCQVLENLLENAAKNLSRRPDPRVEVGLSRRAGEDAIFVRDNGPGIDPADQQRIFDPFERANPGTRGSGLGLTIARRIVEAHGGRIWVESEGPDRGSTFYFTLAPPEG